MFLCMCIHAYDIFSNKVVRCFVFTFYVTLILVFGFGITCACRKVFSKWTYTVTVASRKLRKSCRRLMVRKSLYSLFQLTQKKKMFFSLFIHIHSLKKNSLYQEKNNLYTILTTVKITCKTITLHLAPFSLLFVTFWLFLIYFLQMVLICYW